MKTIVVRPSDVNVLCRSCLLKNEKLTSIHEEQKVFDKMISVAAMLESITNIQVLTNEEDHLPKEVCQTCLDDIKKFYSFRLQFIYCDGYLKNLLKEQQNLVQVKTEEDMSTKSNDATEVDNTQLEELVQILSDIKQDEGLNNNPFNLNNKHSDTVNFINDGENTKDNNKPISQSKINFSQVYQKYTEQKDITVNETKFSNEADEESVEKTTFFSDTDDDTLPGPGKLIAERALKFHGKSISKTEEAVGKGSSKTYLQLDKRKYKINFRKRTCKFCGCSFRTHNAFSRHVFLKHPNDEEKLVINKNIRTLRIRRKKCGECHRRVMNLKEHQWLFCEFKPALGKILGEIINNRPKRNLRSNDPPIKSFNCDLCPKKFRKESSLTVHEVAHIGDRLELLKYDKL